MDSNWAQILAQLDFKTANLKYFKNLRKMALMNS